MPIHETATDRVLTVYSRCVDEATSPVAVIRTRREVEDLIALGNWIFESIGEGDLDRHGFLLGVGLDDAQAGSSAEGDYRAWLAASRKLLDWIDASGRDFAGVDLFRLNLDASAADRTTRMAV